MNTTFKRCLMRLLCLILCMATLPAFADDRTADTYYFGGTGQETVYKATPLPNGNLLLNGSTQLGRNGVEQLSSRASHPTRAWLLCIDPQGEIVWEVISEEEGTNRYVTPQVSPNGEITVLYYNSPGQVTLSMALHRFSQDGQLLEKIDLPLGLNLVEGLMTDGFLFYHYETGYQVCDLKGNIRKLEIDKADRLTAYGTSAYIPHEDGWIMAGRAHNEDAGYALAQYDQNGKQTWYFTTGEYAEGIFWGPVFDDQQRMYVNWYKLNMETEEITDSRMLCFDENKQLIREFQLPAECCGGFVVTEEGFTFYKQWMEKTYTHIEFLTVDHDGQLLERRQAEKRREMIFGGELFLWNGEVWYHGDAEREANRTDDRKTDLELADCSLIRMKDCALATAQ